MLMYLVLVDFKSVDFKVNYYLINNSVYHVLFIEKKPKISFLEFHILRLISYLPVST